MSVVDSTIHTADHLDRAHVSEASYIQRRLDENASERIHEYVILLTKDDEVVEDSYTGSPSDRVEYLENPPTHELRPGLGVDLEADSWATGYYDRTARAWKVCGNDLALKHMIATRPRPVG